MGEKMNKSQRHLIDAFMEVREKKSLEKISVVELCKMAEVNKSTFYAYYHDVYDLSDQLQTAAFSEDSGGDGGPVDHRLRYAEIHAGHPEALHPRGEGHQHSLLRVRILQAPAEAV